MDIIGQNGNDGIHYEEEPIELGDDLSDTEDEMTLQKGAFSRKI